MQPAYCTPNTPCMTHSALHIRDITDAQRVLQAVRMGILPLVRRRLAPHERAQLKSGNVFVWEESESEEGLVRWTEGRRWSQSRMRGDCLIYEEKIETTEEEKKAKAFRRALKASESSEPIPPPPKRKDRPTKADGLTKHTYTFTVKLQDGSEIRKWHLVAYFSARESPFLPVVEDYTYLRDIQIPKGAFGHNNTGQSATGSLDHFPRPTEITGAASESSPSTPRSLWESELEIRHSRRHQWFSHPAAFTLPPISSVPSPITLPPLSSLVCFLPTSCPTQRSFSPPSPCLCSDDRRILEKFRVVI